MAKRKQIGSVPPELKKLSKNQDQTVSDVLKELRNAQSTIAKEVAYLAGRSQIMTNAKQRDKIYKLINGHYQRLSRNIDEHIAALVSSTAEETHKKAAEDLKTSGKATSVVKYDPARTERYLALINNMSSKSMVAVFTDKMSDESIRALRTAWVSVYRQASISGMSANDTQRQLQSEWDKLVDNVESFRFVDKSSRSWSNARYLQMLIRTNAQRVVRDSYIDTLIENGFELAKISDDGDADCPICAAWEGRIIQVAGQSRKWPSYEDAVSAGVFHPNCMHRLKYVDETLDAKEIELQGKLAKPPEGSTNNFIQAQKDQLDKSRYTSQGMSKIEAQRAVTRDRLKRNVLTGTFNESAQAAVDGLTDDQLDNIWDKGIPAFQMVKKGEDPGWNKGSKGGIVRIPRDAGPDDVLKAMGLENKDALVSNSSSQDVLKKSIEQASKAGYSEPLLDAIRKTPTTLLKKITLPELVPHKEAFYRQDDGKIRMPVDANTWSGHPVVFHHELGHHIERTLGATTKLGANGKKWIKEPEPEFKTAMQADEKTWQKRAGELFGENWKKDMRFAGTWEGKLRRYKMNDVVAKASGLAETYQDLNDEGKHRIRALLDTFHGISGGRYGDGHESGYQKRLGSGEVFANCYQASVMGWSEFELAFPEVIKYVKGKSGAKI